MFTIRLLIYCMKKCLIFSQPTIQHSSWFTLSWILTIVHISKHSGQNFNISKNPETFFSNLHWSLLILVVMVAKILWAFRIFQFGHILKRILLVWKFLFTATMRGGYLARKITWTPVPPLQQYYCLSSVIRVDDKFSSFHKYLRYCHKSFTTVFSLSSAIIWA